MKNRSVHFLIKRIATFLLTATCLIHCSHCQLTPDMDLDFFIEKLWNTPECEDFVYDWQIVGTFSCGASLCNYPREVCVINSVDSTEIGRFCQNLTDGCFESANSGGENGQISPESVEKTTTRSATTTTSTITALTSSASPSQQTTTLDPNYSLIKELCNVPKDKGTIGRQCKRSYNYYFDKRRNICSRMIYLGCGGNENRFEKHEDCLEMLQICKDVSKKEVDEKLEKPSKPICNLDKPKGRFCGFQLMFYFDKIQKRCLEFWFPGCNTTETNDNLFQNLANCEKRADFCNREDAKEKHVVTKQPDAICSLERSVGDWNCSEPGWTRRYYFDQGIKECRLFWYQGCNGNENNFRYLHQCKQQCSQSVRS